MTPTPITAERYLRIINTLIPKGWMPIGQFGSMTFRRNGKNYDLSAADLDQLDRIEREGLFLATTMNTPEQQLSQSLLAACKAAGIEKPKYIFQGWLGGIYHSDEDPRTTSSPIFFTYEKSIGVNHPPYASDWQDSLLTWVDQGEPLADVLTRHPEHVADTSKMIDMQDAIADAYRNHVGRCGLQTYAQTYHQGWQDALAWKGGEKL